MTLKLDNSIPKDPYTKQLWTLRTFLKGFTCNLTLSHFLGQNSKKTTLYLAYLISAFDFSQEK